MAQDNPSEKTVSFGRPRVPSRAQRRLASEVNVDLTGMDPEMKDTIGEEAARRTTFAGVQMQPKGPFSGFIEGLHKIFGGKPRK